jgi:hypothetical protein
VIEAMVALHLKKHGGRPAPGGEISVRSI